MSAGRKRGLSLFMAFGSIFWLVLFSFALITMQLSPPKSPISNDLVVGAIGLAGFGLFGWSALAIGRATAYMDGTTLHYNGGFWFGYRTADLARVTKALVKEDKRDDGYDLVLSGNGKLKKFPLAHPATGVLPELSREILATALAANPDKAVTAEAIATLRSSFAESLEESGPS